MCPGRHLRPWLSPASTPSIAATTVPMPAESPIRRPLNATNTRSQMVSSSTSSEIRRTAVPDERAFSMIANSARFDATQPVCNGQSHVLGYGKLRNDTPGVSIPRHITNSLSLAEARIRFEAKARKSLMELELKSLVVIGEELPRSCPKTHGFP